MKISEVALLQKIGLSYWFLQKILCTKKSKLGVEIFTPSTIIIILTLKLYLEHRRNNNKVSNQIFMTKKTCNFSMNSVAK